MGLFVQNEEAQLRWEAVDAPGEEPAALGASPGNSLEAPAAPAPPRSLLSLLLSTFSSESKEKV